jgi:hypothetical protein
MSDLDILHFTMRPDGRVAKGDHIVAYRNDVAIGSFYAQHSDGITWSFSLGQVIWDGKVERISEAKRMLVETFERWCGEAGLTIDGPSRVPFEREGNHDQSESDATSG